MNKNKPMQRTSSLWEVVQTGSRKLLRNRMERLLSYSAIVAVFAVFAQLH